MKKTLMNNSLAIKINRTLVFNLQYKIFQFWVSLTHCVKSCAAWEFQITIRSVGTGEKCY